MAEHTAADQALYALLHLAGRLVSEGDCKDISWVDAALADQVGDAIRERPRLAAAGSGKYEEGAVRVLDCLFLSGVQMFENLTHGRSRYYKA